MTEEFDAHSRERLKFPYMTWRDDTPEQRAAVHQRRVEQALIENPELSDEDLADNWGVAVALVTEERVRRRQHGG